MAYVTTMNYISIHLIEFDIYLINNINKSIQGSDTVLRDTYMR